MNFLHKYMLTGACYGFVRKSIDLTMNNPEITLERTIQTVKTETGISIHKYASRNRPMLIMEKTCVLLTHTAIVALYLPIFVSKDLVHFEANIRGIDDNVVHKSTEDDPNIFLINHLFT